MCVGGGQRGELDEQMRNNYLVTAVEVEPPLLTRAVRGGVRVKRARAVPLQRKFVTRNGVAVGLLLNNAIRLLLASSVDDGAIRPRRPVRQQARHWSLVDKGVDLILRRGQLRLQAGHCRRQGRSVVRCTPANQQMRAC